MNEHSRHTMIIGNGSLASLVATMSAEQGSSMGRDAGAGAGLVFYVPDALSPLLPVPTDGGATAAIRRAIERQAEFFGVGEIVWGGAEAVQGASDASAGNSARMGLTRALIGVLEAASEVGCDRVLWPVVLGERLDELQSMAERATMLSHLAGLELPGEGVSLELPMADLTHGLLISLATDLDAPVGYAWDAGELVGERTG